ncbi:hypothetical protein HBI13_061040 [Parastagonospora nodorum]|nr:hypothetical protein HBI13_061040 [Parastagonospora nodorum]
MAKAHDCAIAAYRIIYQYISGIYKTCSTRSASDPSHYFAAYGSYPNRLYLADYDLWHSNSNANIYSMPPMPERQSAGIRIIEKDGILKVTKGTVTVKRGKEDNYNVEKDDDYQVKVGDILSWIAECDYEIDYPT